MILLSVQRLSKHFGDDTILDDVAFEVRPGQKIGLVGPNGAGKSTLLKIVAGRLDADSGEVELHASARMDYLEQHPTITPGKTLWQEAEEALSYFAGLPKQLEAVAAEMSTASDPAEHRRLAERYDRLQHEVHTHDAYNLKHRIERVLQGLGFSEADRDKSVEILSGGQQNRLMLAKLLLGEADLLLLDEPSNHLDIDATQWLEQFLAECNQAIIVVSHDRYFLDKVTNHTFELFDGTIDEYTGNFSAYWRQKDERNLVATRAFEKQQVEIAKTEDFIRRNFAGQKSAQAKDREKKLARIERVRPPRTISAPAMGFPPASRTGDIVLRVENLSKAFDRPLFKDLSFDILRGQRFGILGPNGTGKTTLLRCVIGQLQPTAGKVSLGAGVKIGYYDQLLSGLDPETQVVDAIRPPGKDFNEPQRRSLLARFGVVGDAVFQRVGSLSGGERSRAALARLSAAESNFLILDEPTNHLDLWARDSLERTIREFEGAVLFVSHDRYFVNQVADHVLVVEPSRFRVVEGNYDTYQHLVKQGLAGEKAEVTEDSKAPRGRPAKSSVKSKRRFPYRKVADLEAEIFEREQRIESLQSLLADPDVLRDGPRVKKIHADTAAERETLASLYEHWEEATELN